MSDLYRLTDEQMGKRCAQPTAVQGMRLPTSLAG